MTARRTRQLVLAGGGHAHLHTLNNLKALKKAGITTTIVSPSPFHYYSGMGPGMLAGRYQPDELRFDLWQLAEAGGATFVLAAAIHIAPETQKVYLNTGVSLDYHALSFNIGSRIEPPLASNAPLALPVKPIENLIEAKKRVQALARQSSTQIVIVGGGAAGVELAGNVWQAVKEQGGKPRITLIAGRSLLSAFPEEARQIADYSLTGRGIVIREGVKVAKIDQREAILDDGSSIGCDLALLATGVRPPPIFRESGLPVGEDGALKVNQHLQSPAYPALFGGGDCISFGTPPLPRVGVFAVRQGLILYRNLLAFLTGQPLITFRPQKSYLQLLNLGDGTALFIRNNIVWHGKAALLLKDWIDRKFISKYSGG